MAGFAEGPAAEAAFLGTLDHACRAGPDLVMLIEPLNRYDAPGYFLTGSDQAARLIERAGHANLRLMFDCYHLQIMEGDLTRRLRRHLPIVGHVQVASVPDRGPPDHGEVDYRHICGVLRELGWERPVGAEYRPGGATEDTLGWLAALGGTARGSAS
jgi:hydroxypyruvate isomerase